MNLYGFAGGDPVNFWDPFGLVLIVRGDAEFEAMVDEVCAGDAKDLCDELHDSDKTFYLVQADKKICGNARTAALRTACGSPNGVTFGAGNTPAELADFLSPDPITGGVAMVNTHQGKNPTEPYRNWGEAAWHEMGHELGVARGVGLYRHPRRGQTCTSVLVGVPGPTNCRVR